ncbi:cspA, partial [Symbiodinium microadriaticum]
MPGQFLSVYRSHLRSADDLCQGDDVSFLKDWDSRQWGTEMAVDVQVVLPRPQAANVHAVIKEATMGSAYPAAFQGVPCTGVVKRWLPDKGYGFVKPDAGGADIYVHQSALEGVAALSCGDHVSFLRLADVQGQGKFRASQVSVIRSGNLFQDLPPHPIVPEGPVGEALLLQLAREQESSEMLDFLDRYLLRSSLDCPFLVLSEGQLVESVPAPSVQDLQRLKQLVRNCIDTCEEYGAALLVDFEGEMPGHGGEVSIAQVQFTQVLDLKTLSPLRLNPLQRFQCPGFLLDLRCPSGVEIIRQVMGSQKILKILWGAQGDCQCLMYQLRPFYIGVYPMATLDAQVAFDASVLIGMAKMLQTVPSETTGGLPIKEDQINWDASHCENKRALEVPLSRESALYAVDDLHRIEAIVGTKLPPSGSYAAALQHTAQMLLGLRQDPCGLSTLEQDLRWLEKRDGTKKMVKAVQIARHCISVQLRFSLGGRDNSIEAYPEVNLSIQTALARANEVLQTQNVHVPPDLSFNNDHPSPSGSGV